MNSKEKSISLPLVILFVVVAAIAFAALGYWEGKKTTDTDTDESVPMPPVPAEPTDSVNATASATADETANWKTYTNDTYGFSFKYPSDWTTQDISTTGDDVLSSVAFVDPAGKDAKVSFQAKNIFLKIYSKTDNLSLTDWLTNKYKASQGELADYKVGSKIMLGGVSGFLSSIGCCGYLDNSYVVENGSNVYMLGSNSSDEISILSQITSTFQFTPVK